MNGAPTIYATAEELAQGAASILGSLLHTGAHDRGMATLALSGGGTPRRVYQVLASQALRPLVPWERIHVFWGDERCVPPEHPDSNFRMADEALLRHVPIPGANIHRMKGELPPDQGRAMYEQELSAVFHLAAGTMPEFDVVLLGLGDDGHTASLFPGTDSLSEGTRPVTSVFVEKLRSNRVTLTLPAINNARHIIFLVSGRGKAAILGEVLKNGEQKFPAQRVRPIKGDLRWLIDQEAASQLKQGGKL